MDRRKRQLDNNLYGIFGMYANGISDHGTDEYPLMNHDTALDYALSQVYDMKDDGAGWTRFANGICKDLKFLGNNYIYARILEIADECGVLIPD